MDMARAASDGNRRSVSRKPLKSVPQPPPHRTRDKPSQALVISVWKLAKLEQRTLTGRDVQLNKELKRYEKSPQKSLNIWVVETLR
jgi:hypothetical protein